MTFYELSASDHKRYMIKFFKALKEIRDMDTDDDYDLHVARRIIDKMQMIAKKALEAK